VDAGCRKIKLQTRPKDSEVGIVAVVRQDPASSILSSDRFRIHPTSQRGMLLLQDRCKLYVVSR